MSKERIKIGRYSRERRQQNFSKLSAIIAKKPTIPYLMNFADADIVTVYCRESFSKYRDIIWGNEIENLYDKMSLTLLEVTNNTCPREDFMDVLEVCGIEIDSRRNLIEIGENFLRKNLKYLYSFARDLPGGRELPPDDFLQHFFNQTEDIKFTLVCAHEASEENGDLNFRIDNHFFKMQKSEMINLFDQQLSNLLYENLNRKNELKITPEESMFIFATHIIQPKPNFPQLSIANQRLNLAFTRYMQTVYGEGYHNRMRDLINFIAFFKESVFVVKKWIRKHEKYLNHLSNCKIIRRFWKGENSDLGSICLDELIKA